RPLAGQDRRRLRIGALRRLRLHPEDPPLASALRSRPEQLLRLLPADHRQDELGPALLLRRARGRDRTGRNGGLRGLPLVPLPAAARRTRDRPRARRARRRGSDARAAALVGADGGARRDDGGEHLLPDDVVLLLL